MITNIRLQAFITTARELSFTRAAEELCISQPAITKHIKELERILGVPLFRRNGNRINLTEEGERLLPYAQSVISSYQQMCDVVMSETGDLSGRLRLGASTTITQYILPTVLAQFREEYPRVEVTLVSGNSEEILHFVETERVDLALIEDAQRLTTFHYEHFAEDRVVLVSAQKQRQAITLDELQKLPLVLRENGSGTLNFVEHELSKHNISRRSLNVSIQIGSSEGIMRYLKSSRCYAFISEAAAREYIERGELYECHIEGVKLRRELRFASLQGNNTRLIELFKEYARQS